MLYQNKTLIKNDIVVAKCKFIGLNQDGAVMLKAISEKVVGVNDQ